MGLMGRGAPPSAVEAELERTRRRLGDLLDELDRRRHELKDVRLQMQRHAVSIMIAAGGAMALIAVAIGTTVRRRRRRNTLGERAHRLRVALRRAIAHPNRVAKEQPAIWKKVLAAAGSSAAGLVAKRAIRAATTRSAS